MLNNNLKKLSFLASSAGLAVASSPTFAKIDTAFVATMQTDVVDVLTKIGAALLIAGGVAVAFKWGKAALFG